MQLAHLLTLAGLESQRLSAQVRQIVLQRDFVLEVALLLALLGAEQWRLRDVEVAALDDLDELAEEQGEQQRAYMRTVDVGVGHDDNGVVAQLAHVFFVRHAHPERHDQRAQLLRGEHLFDPYALDVENLATQRQDGLDAAVAALLGRAAGRIALHDEQFAARGVALLAIGEFAGQRARI